MVKPFAVVLLLLVTSAFGQVGSIAVFDPPAGDGLVFRSIANYEEFKKAQDANDDEGYLELAKSGKVTIMKSGARLRILDYNVYRNLDQVRVLSGKLSGVVVWTPAPWVKASRSSNR
jgi:hypothetical protein